MVDSWASSEHARRTMRANRRKNTVPELRIRTMLHALGMRYRVDAAPLLGQRRKADIVFTAARIAVFIDGCFWHGCPEHFVLPKTNRGYWEEKIARNQKRDIETDRALIKAGWAVIRVWEHDDPARVVDRIRREWLTRRPE